jgi:hypothetical protein
MLNSDGVHRDPFNNGIRMVMVFTIGLEVIFVIAKMFGFEFAIFPIIGLLIPLLLCGVFLLGPWVVKIMIAGFVNYLNRDSNGIVLGETFGWPSVSIFLEDDEREGHMAILGRTGSGKSTQMMAMIDQDIVSSKPLIIVDPHTSIAHNTVDRCVIHNRIPVLLEPDTENMNTLNLLETSPGYGPSDAAKTVMEGIVQAYLAYEHEVPTKIKHLLETAVYLLSAVDEGYTLLELRRWMIQAQFRNDVAVKVAEKSEPGRWLEASHALGNLEWYNGLTAFQKHDQMQSTWTRVAAFLDHPDIRKMLGCSKSTFDFQQVRNGMPLVVSISDRTVHRDSRVVNAVILTWITQKMLEGSMDIWSARPLSLFVDELAEISPESFERVLLHGRKCGVHLTCIVQAQTMLDHRLFRTVMANMSNLLIFGSSGPGVEDLSREIIRPLDAESKQGAVNSHMELNRQIHAMASRIRDLRKHEFLNWNAYRPGPPLHCKTPEVRWNSFEAVKLNRAHALRQVGRPVQDIEDEIRERTEDLDARYGRLHSFGGTERSDFLAPW